MEVSMRRMIQAVAVVVATAWLVPGLALAGGDAKKGNDLFHQNCAVCHGPAGKGDGPGGTALNPKPRDLTDKAYMAALDDKKVHEAIAKGGPAIGKSPLMPPMGGALSAEQIDDIIAYVRTLAK
jgi:mono/diheme cytochrome c family protein